MQCRDEDVNVEAVGVRKGKGPVFGTCWTCGGSHFVRKGEEKGNGNEKPTSPVYGSCWTCGGNHFSR